MAAARFSLLNMKPLPGFCASGISFRVRELHSRLKRLAAYRQSSWASNQFCSDAESGGQARRKDVSCLALAR